MNGPLVSTRVLGTTTVSVVFGGQVHWSPAFPLADLLRGEEIELDDRRRVLMGYNWLAISTGSDVVLVDPADWRGGEVFGTLQFGHSHPLDTALGALGIAPADVTHVVITHGHIDHVLGLIDARGGLRFPSAAHHVPAADWSDPVISSGPVRSRLEPIEHAGRLALTRGDAEICSHVRVLAAPGETAGHQVVEVTDGDGSVYYLADLVHFAFEFSEADWVIVAGGERAELVASRRRICERAAERNADVVFTHAPAAGWARLRPDVGGWRYEPTASTVGLLR